MAGCPTSYVQFTEDILGDEHSTGTLVALLSSATGVTVEGAFKQHSQGLDVALECVAEALCSGH